MFRDSIFTKESLQNIRKKFFFIVNLINSYKNSFFHITVFFNIEWKNFMTLRKFSTIYRKIFIFLRKKMWKWCLLKNFESYSFRKKDNERLIWFWIEGIDKVSIVILRHSSRIYLFSSFVLLSRSEEISPK